MRPRTKSVGKGSEFNEIALICCASQAKNKWTYIGLIQNTTKSKIICADNILTFDIGFEV